MAKDLLGPYEGACVLADSGYDGADLEAWSQAHGIDLLVRARPSRRKEPREWLNGARLMVETVFSMLADQFCMETTRARSRQGVAVRMVAKLASYNLGLVLNRLLGRPLLSVKSLYA